MWSIVVEFVTNIINGIVFKWMQMRESRKRGEAEAENDAHEENARRKEKSDRIMANPVKTGDDLIESIRDRNVDNVS
jgi:hypothetical protein